MRNELKTARALETILTHEHEQLYQLITQSSSKVRKPVQCIKITLNQKDEIMTNTT